MSTDPVARYMWPKLLKVIPNNSIFDFKLAGIESQWFSQVWLDRRSPFGGSEIVFWQLSPTSSILNGHYYSKVWLGNVFRIRQTDVCKIWLSSISVQLVNVISPITPSNLPSKSAPFDIVCKLFSSTRHSRIKISKTGNRVLDTHTSKPIPEYINRCALFHW